MNKLETLLNTLIQMGWKPWGIKADFSEYKFGKFRFIKMSGEIVRMCTLRELVSLESGLWQFCMENGLCKGDIYERIKADLQILGAGESHQSGRDYQYRLIESALVPEEELGKFLLDNIAIGGKKE